MKLTLCLLLFLAVPVGAAPPEIAVLPKPNGYDLLVKAAQAYVAGEEGSPATNENLAPDENLRRQRASVKRNARVLELTREGLALPVQQPPLRDFSQYSGLSTGWRATARLFKQEAAVRVADGDWNGAMQSHLDAIELGVVLARGGPLLPFFTSTAVETLGRRDLEKVAVHLNATQSRAAAQRLEKIENLRPAFVEIVQEERKLAIEELDFHFASPNWKEMLDKQQSFSQEKLDAAQFAYLRTLSAQDIKTNIARAFELIESNSRTPYSTIKAIVPTPADAWTRMTIQTINDPIYRLRYERSRTENRLLHDALLVRAAKLETGVYPTEFATSLDPFGNHFVYRRNGESYQLYSVGPNGKDDVGEPIQTIQTDEKSGTKQVTKRLQVDSFGDILASVL